MALRSLIYLACFRVSVVLPLSRVVDDCSVVPTGRCSRCNNYSERGLSYAEPISRAHDPLVRTLAFCCCILDLHHLDLDAQHCTQMFDADRRLAAEVPTPSLIAKARDGVGDDQHYVGISV